MILAKDGWRPARVGPRVRDGPCSDRYRAAPGAATRTMTQFLRVAWLVMRKDLTVEVRSREIVYTTLFFAVSCVLVFAFASCAKGGRVEDAAAGILWIAIAFSGTLALGRTFERERQTETLRALLLAPADGRRSTSASCSASSLLLAAEVVLVPLVGAPVPGAALRAARSARRAAGRRHARVRRRRDAVCGDARARAQPRRAAAGAVVSDHDSGHHCRRARAPRRCSRPTPTCRWRAFWLALLAFFDVVFVTLSLWTFEPLMTE